MSQAEGYEVQGTPYDQKLDRNAMINQVTEDLIPAHAGYGFKVKFMGEDQMSVTYHCFEMDLPLRVKEVEQQAQDLLKQYEKHLKKEYKSRAGKTLKLKELKGGRSESTEKVSLNNRYYYRSSRTYEI